MNTYQAARVKKHANLIIHVIHDHTYKHRDSRSKNLIMYVIYNRMYKRRDSRSRDLGGFLCCLARRRLHPQSLPQADVGRLEDVESPARLPPSNLACTRPVRNCTLQELHSSGIAARGANALHPPPPAASPPPGAPSKFVQTREMFRSLRGPSHIFLTHSYCRKPAAVGGYGSMGGDASPRLHSAIMACPVVSPSLMLVTFSSSASLTWV